MCKQGKLFARDDNRQEFSMTCHLMNSECQFVKDMRHVEMRMLREAIKTAIPPVHADNLDSIKENQLLHDVDSWEWQKYPFLIISGRVGTGKSMGACWAYKNWVKGFITDNSWNDEAQKRKIHDTGAKSLLWLHSYGLLNERYDLSEAVITPFLVIDDLAAEDSKEWTKARLNYLISMRYDMKKPTVITTNLPPKQFLEAYGQRINDRLNELGYFIYAEGQSMRSVIFEEESY